MKKLLFILPAALIYFLFSCTNADHATASADDQSEKANANMREIYKALETGDVSKVDSIVAKDVVDHEPKADGKEIRGLDELKAYFADFHNHFSGLKFDVIAQATEGDYHFALVNFSGTTTDSLFAPPNTKIDEKIVDVVRIKDGKGVEHWGFRDAAAVEAMMKKMAPPK